jgi:NADPH:quinone reductase-like Zn-dependent oxidoreductase
MRGVILRKNGPIDALGLGEIEAPEPLADQILVRVRAAAVNPADLKVVTGEDGGGFIHAMQFPMAFGYDFSGVVEQVGSDVTARVVGDEVFGHLAYSRSTRQGSFAELVAVRPSRVGVKPSSVSFEDAAAAATVGCTALQALRDKGRLKAGQRVLINGASGGVGSYAVQIARQLGAEVWGTASAAKADFVSGLGAAEVIDYRATPLTSIGKTFDVVLDAASRSSFQQTRRLINRGGAYVTLLPSASLLGGMLLSLFSSKRCSIVTVQSRATDLDQLGAWMAAGQLDASVERTYRLSEVGDALAALKSGAVQGKLAVRVSD